MLHEPKATTERLDGCAAEAGAAAEADDAGTPGTLDEELRVKHVEPMRLNPLTFRTSLRRSFIASKPAVATAELS